MMTTRRSASSSSYPVSHVARFTLNDSDGENSDYHLNDKEKHHFDKRYSNKSNRNLKYIMCVLIFIVLMLTGATLFSFSSTSKYTAQTDPELLESLHLLDIVSQEIKEHYDDEPPTSILWQNPAGYSTEPNIEEAPMSYSIERVHQKIQEIELVVNKAVEKQDVLAAKTDKYKTSSNDTPKDGKTEIVYPSQDLKEMLALSPMTILLYEDNPNEVKFNRILQSLDIVPPPTVVNLRKHPHHKAIVEYLQTYRAHYHTLSKDDHDFVRVFVNSKPVANVGEVILMYADNSLVSVLKSAGRGTITVG